MVQISEVMIVSFRHLHYIQRAFHNKRLRNVHRQMSGQQMSNRHMSPSARIFPSFRPKDGMKRKQSSDFAVAGNLNGDL